MLRPGMPAAQCPQNLGVLQSHRGLSGPGYRWSSVWNNLGFPSALVKIGSWSSWEGFLFRDLGRSCEQGTL